MLISARGRAAEHGAGIALPADTARIMGIVGLDRVFPIHDDVAAATTAHSSDPSCRQTII
ncbi:hypothetical protein C6N75_15940 [Streptomyces solincola]|uniref:STAS domain-containing protein n=1 Tax=Streptomyces solincola TaxID=2100817 RepID=A0A2S9PUZ5_9ACTN|nr:hypothetical protein [Streptomyces solincola]PRH78242.1 hypothetical protein C6N75_15940 [Streptomyces solincola]